MKLREEPAYIQARITAYRLGEAMKRLQTFNNPPSESELTWLLDTADAVLMMALVHAQECERLWKESGT